MSTDVRHDCEHEVSATRRSPDASLPECLAGLVSEDVWAQSNQRVEERLQDRTSREVRERLYVEMLADHLVREVEDDHGATVEDAAEGLSRRAA